jgi:hypothetical protein
VRARPVPPKVIACGLLEALSVRFSEALRLPLADGVNATITVQVSLGVTVAPVQVSALLTKSLAFVPLIVAVEMVRMSVPLLVMVSVRGALEAPTGAGPNGRLVEEGLTTDASEIFAT